MNVVFEGTSVSAWAANVGSGLSGISFPLVVASEQDARVIVSTTSTDSTIHVAPAPPPPPPNPLGAIFGNPPPPPPPSVRMGTASALTFANVGDGHLFIDFPCTGIFLGTGSMLLVQGNVTVTNLCLLVYGMLPEFNSGSISLQGNVRLPDHVWSSHNHRAWGASQWSSDEASSPMISGELPGTLTARIDGQTVGTLTRNPADNSRAATGIFENVLQEFLSADRPDGRDWGCCTRGVGNGYCGRFCPLLQAPELNDLHNAGGCCYHDGDPLNLYHGRDPIDVHAYADGYYQSTGSPGQGVTYCHIYDFSPGRPELQQICDLAHGQ